jgi:hypothetical protein
MTPVALLAACLLTYGASPYGTMAPGTYANGVSAYSHHCAQNVPYPPASVGYTIAEVPAVGEIGLSGRVVRPGDYAYYPGMTVSSVIGDAGSFASEADYQNIEIVRQTPDGEQVYSLSWLINWHRFILLEPGDTLIVPDRSLRTY